jgi:hypothetical protein
VPVELPEVPDIEPEPLLEPLRPEDEPVVLDGEYVEPEEPEEPEDGVYDEPDEPDEPEEPDPDEPDPVEPELPLLDCEKAGMARSARAPVAMRAETLRDCFMDFPLVEVKRTWRLK